MLPLEIPDFEGEEYAKEEKEIIENSIDEDDYIFKKNKPFYVIAPEVANG